MTEAFSLRPDVEALSPNREPRADGRAPDLVILHYTGMATAQAALDRLRDPEAKVSAHYLIDQDGALFGLAPEAERAWHAGVSSWRDDRDVNSRAIGIEIVNPGHPWEDSPAGYSPFPEPQMAALERVLSAVLARWDIAPAGVLGHSDVAPGRKIDPGEKFDWARLARRGLAETTPAPAPADGAEDPAAFRAALAACGYGDWPDAALLDAFRRRFRPTALGRAFEAADARLAKALAARKAQ